MNSVTTSSQSGLGLIITPERRPQDGNVNILEATKMLQDQKWLPPQFQREFVWTKKQISMWGETIEEDASIGVIVTYQLAGGGPYFVLDGLQRLNATIRYCEDPQAYGFKYDSAQALAYCERFSIPRQHRIYKDHDTAFDYFERLNRGTVLTPYELYHGLLTLSGTVGGMLAHRIPEIVVKYESSYVTTAHNRHNEQGRIRDAYCLFLQHVTKTPRSKFWHATGSTLNLRSGITPIEKALASEIQSQQWTILDAEKLLKNFDLIMSQDMAEIVTLHEEAGGKGKAINSTLWRWLLHARLWARNIGRPVASYQHFTQKLLAYMLDRYGATKSSFDLEANDGTVFHVTLGLGELRTHLKLSEFLGCDLHEDKTRKKAQSAPGYHASHKLPFSTHGEGETFQEPASRNMARGAKPVTPNDDDDSEKAA
jgi:hypothetical protein